MEEPLMRNNNNQEEADERHRREELERQLLQQEDDDDGHVADEDEDEANNDQLPQAPQHYIPSHNSLSYTKVSFVAALATIVYALRSREQYYLAVVFLSSSKWAYCCMGNAVIALTLQIFRSLTHIVLGGLRVHEAEGLGDYFRWNVTETCIALTMFRHELNLSTSFLFLMLVCSKCLHHVAILREQHLRMTEDAVVDNGHGLPTVPWHYLKLLGMLFLLQLADIYSIQFRVDDIVRNGPSVSILFAFEAAISLVAAWSHLLLMGIHLIDGLIHYLHDQTQSPWAHRLLHPWKEYKATLTFAVELQAQGLQFIFYMMFFGIIMVWYGMPLNLIREVYISFLTLRDRLTGFLRYRRLMASMNRFQDVTDEQIEELGRICIICRDEMTERDCKQLPGCQHLFHKSCLREWLVQQQSCPTCRSDITAMERREEQRRTAEAAAQQRREHGDEDGAAADDTIPADEAPTGVPNLTTEQEETIAHFASFRMLWRVKEATGVYRKPTDDAPLVRNLEAGQVVVSFALDGLVLSRSKFARIDEKGWAKLSSLELIDRVQ